MLSPLNCSPQSTMATAQVIFHRFFYVSSMLSFGITVRPAPPGGAKLQDISASALYLSSKLNETPLRLRDLINTYLYLQARIKHLLALPADHPLAALSMAARNGSQKGKGRAKDPVWEGFVFEVPGFHDEVFWDCACLQPPSDSAYGDNTRGGADHAAKDVIVASEMQLLKRLGFNMQVTRMFPAQRPNLIDQVDLPYSHVINYLRILDLVFDDDVAQTCWSILNDAYVCSLPSPTLNPQAPDIPLRPPPATYPRMRRDPPRHSHQAHSAP